MAERPHIFGVPVDVLSMDETVARCLQLIDERRPAQVVGLNAQKVVLMEDDQRIRDIVRTSDLVSIDGQSVVWAGRMHGVDVPERVAGIDLMMRMLDEAERRELPVYFLGAKGEVIERFVERVRELHPRLPIAGYRDGYFSDDAAVADAVAASGARLLLVGIPSPRKEYFVTDMLPRLGPLLAIGIGGSFDVIAGFVTRAPVWMQRSGLEWAHRFAKDPRGMWRRYLVGNSRFLAITVRELLRRGRSPVSGTEDA